MSYWRRKEYEQLGFDDTTASVLEVDRVQEIIRRRAERYRVNVLWDRSIHTAVTINDPNPDSPYDFIIKIPVIESPCSKEDLIRTYMYVVHECGHLLRPEVWDISLTNKPCAELQAIFNIVEDDSMERDVANRNLGDAKVLGEGNAIMCKDGEIYWRKQVEKARELGKSFTEESLLPMITMAIQLLARKEWDGWSREAIDDWLKVMPSEGMDLMVALVKEGWVDKFRNTKTPYDSWDVANELFDRLYPYGVVEPPPPPDGPGKGKGTDEEGNDEGTDKPQQGQAGEDGDTIFEEVDKEEGQDEDGYVINWNDILWSQHSDEQQAHGNGGPAGITFEGKAEEQGVAFAPHNEIQVLPLYEKGYSLPDNTGRHYTRRNRAAKHFAPCPNKGATLANQVRRYVQSHTRAKIRNERETGMLSNQDVARLLMPPVDAGNWNRKIFYDLQRKRAINTAIHILVDWSGSMAGPKSETAAQAAIRAATVFDRQLRMPTMVSAFTAYDKFCDIGIIKPFGIHQKPDDMAQSFATFCQWHGGNDDADAVMWGYRELMRRKEPRKIMLVMSDGAPAGAYKGDYHSALLAATRHIQDEGKIDLFGLGIKSEAVKLYYNKYAIIDSVNEINEGLLKVLQQGVRYG